MDKEILRIKSKINLLNAQVGQLNDSALFTPQEISELSAPMVVQVQELQNQLQNIRTNNMEVSTPQTLNA